MNARSDLYIMEEIPLRDTVTHTEDPASHVPPRTEVLPDDRGAPKDRGASLRTDVPPED